MSHFLSHLSVVPLSLWGFFILGILVLLIIDLSFFGKSSESFNKKSALLESGLWIGIALCFNTWFAYAYGSKLGLEFLTGYLVEKSLSVDNLFVILLIFNSFRIPARYQHRVLFYGVLGAIVLRALFIILGAQILHAFNWVMYIFGAILIITALKILIEKEHAQENPKENKLIAFLKRHLPYTSNLQGPHFLTTENHIKKVTPLFFALVAIEIADLIFAVDSIPAVFSVTQDAFVAFASNILAILGLRALYFVLADWVSKLRYLKPGLAAILGFIGIKMLIADIFNIPSLISFLVIVGVLVLVAVSSWFATRQSS